MPSFEEEAFARAQKMNMRGKPNGFGRPQHSSNRPPTQSQSNDQKSNQTEPLQNSCEEKTEIGNQTTGEREKENTFEKIFRDKDKSIILILLVLLMDEKSDPSLILSLIYLLL